ncbi:MAG: phosphoribosylaminoimidazolesuccinocarboxamide synthase [Candidatus Daviesbacteria bacterium]|nr:phosphoribosylaminoimidazolesuccinocarboxamide synthase [Candidatus Daviesbacteria bacterium]
MTQDMVAKRIIIENIAHVLKTVDIPNLGKKYSGKVRDSYELDDKRVIITTDRQSAFDHVLGYIPFKGQVLNQLSAFWFNKTSDIIQNHLLCVPDPNVMVVKNCQVIPVEMVVRGYITGVTDTSIWGSYEKGERVIYGIKFPEGLRKNQKLPKPVITPTTKAKSGHHDEKLSEKDIIQRKIVTPAIWKQMETAALALFARGQKICDKAGIILVDTKYEFGFDNEGELMLVDELHTPDSSRYWVKKTYNEKFKKGLEPESYDKEPLRIWFKEHGYTGKGKIPKMPPSFIAKMSRLYMGIYEKITGKRFIPDMTKNVNLRIMDNLRDII